MNRQPFPRCGLLTLAVIAAASAFTANATSQITTSPWTISGDVRFRLESNDTNGVSDRHRQRMRLRLGASYAFSDEFTLGGRLTTGDPDDRKSPHQDLGGGLNKMSISLDRLYMQYAPASYAGLALVAGKFGNPVYRNPVYGELVWDADVQPEGLAVVYDTGELGPFDKSGFVGAQIAVLEQSAGEDLWATLLSWHGSSETSEDSSYDFGVSYYHYGDLTPDGSGALLGAGNAEVGSEYASDFGILDVIGAYSFGKFVVSGEIIKNMRAAAGTGDSGYAYGGAMNTDVGKFYYQFQTIEQDAVLAAVSQDDFLYTNNHNSHLFGWKKGLMEKLGLHVWMMVSEMEDNFGAGDAAIYRFRVDLNFKF